MGKLPEIQKAEEAVALLMRKREEAQEVCCITLTEGNVSFPFYVDMESLAVQLLVDFAISDQAYAKAKIPVTDSVNLWLGANVMLEYPLEEAKSLLVSLLLLHMLLKQGFVKVASELLLASA